MQENKISKRIKFLIDLCPNFKTYADIGCDHGYTALNLIQTKKCKFVYCVDIHLLSLEKAKILFQNNNIQDKAKFYCCDGFCDLTKQERDEIDCAVIAGMGGIETIKILDIYKPQNLVLQPMHNQKELREYLIKNNYTIKKDIVFSEKNKFYTFLLCEKSDNITLYSDFELEFGKSQNNIDYINYIKFQKEKYIKIFRKTNNEHILNVLQNLENVLNYKR